VRWSEMERLLTAFSLPPPASRLPPSRLPPPTFSPRCRSMSIFILASSLGPLMAHTPLGDQGDKVVQHVCNLFCNMF
jgi:hypothetical protein